MQTEGVDNVVDLDGAVLKTLLSLLSRGVGTSVCSPVLDFAPVAGLTRLLTDLDSAEGDHGAVDFVHGSIDLLQVIGVGDNLVTGNDILER